MKAAPLKAKTAKVKTARKAVPYRDHDRATIESFQTDPHFAAEYLNAVLADGDQDELMVALRYMAEAFGGVPQLAARARLNATTLYRTLSAKGNPELKSLTALLSAMGMRLAVQPITEDVN
jgi:probable addiction module antidote protein